MSSHFWYEQLRVIDTDASSDASLMQNTNLPLASGGRGGIRSVGRAETGTISH